MLKNHVIWLTSLDFEENRSLRWHPDLVEELSKRPAGGQIGPVILNPPEADEESPAQWGIPHFVRNDRWIRLRKILAALRMTTPNSVIPSGAPAKRGISRSMGEPSLRSEWQVN